MVINEENDNILQYIHRNLNNIDIHDPVVV